jgi:hypothetical protein
MGLISHTILVRKSVCECLYIQMIKMVVTVCVIK